MPRYSATPVPEWELHGAMQTLTAHNLTILTWEKISSLMTMYVWRIRIDDVGNVGNYAERL